MGAPATPLPLATVQVWAAGVPHEEGVSGQEEPGFGTSGLVNHQQADAVGGMTGRVEDPHLDVTQLELVPIFQRVEGKMRLRSLVEINIGARLRRQLAATGKMIRLNVGLDNMRDPYSASLADLEVLIDLLLWIHHSCRAFSPSPKQVGCTAGLWSEELPEDHCWSPLPRACGALKFPGPFYSHFQPPECIGQINNINNSDWFYE